MAINVTKTILDLRIINNADNIISEVEILIKSVDDSDPSKLTVEGRDRVLLDTSGGTDASGFIAYESLDESTILNWTPVKDRIDLMINNQASWVESVKNPPAPAEVSKALPW
mgnify:CR=1 FL=1|tara:strand:+ start:116 stop:451 length:336 start_codon:yes stop_codon:yes gene_type:complete